MADDVKILGMPPESGRWLLIIIGTIIELCLGAVYAYSIISVPLKTIFTAPVADGGFGLTVSAMEMSLPYIASLAFFALTMPLVGKYIEKYGPRKVGMLGGVIVGLGWILGSMATSPMMLMILYGVIAGIGVGIAYNCPITTAARWFPDKRGLAVGLTLLGFGFSAFITGKMSDILLSKLRRSFRLHENLRHSISDSYCGPFHVPGLPSCRLVSRWMETACSGSRRQKSRLHER